MQADRSITGNLAVRFLKAWMVSAALILIVILTGVGSAARMAPERGEIDLAAAMLTLGTHSADLCGEGAGHNDHGCPLCLVPTPPKPAALAEPARRQLTWRAPIMPPPFAHRTRAPPMPPARAPPINPRTA
ncbi:hypothetical protein DRW48_05605 [Paracoccus suum]|uniref:DUF2946 domain-containing protein n=1 Tax=Paracoccus suum TaxID=2259340 RepID=A0A344PIM2_9RHOB|nr:hypothetical protein [Paracoccus suum]AXC49227.1 hypothetical protein DRW48_05605 [Paracoccus suum]